MSPEDTTFDPTAVQLEAVGRLTGGDLELEELCNTTAVRLLLEQRLVNLVQMKSYENELAELRRENRELIDSRNDLRVEVATSHERDVVSWIEIPVSAMLGFGANLILANNRDYVGWVLLVVTVIILLLLRWSYVEGLPARIRRKERTNAQD